MAESFTRVRGARSSRPARPTTLSSYITALSNRPLFRTNLEIQQGADGVQRADGWLRTGVREAAQAVPQQAQSRHRASQQTRLVLSSLAKHASEREFF